eukprot:gene12864-27129_t
MEDFKSSSKDTMMNLFGESDSEDDSVEVSPRLSITTALEAEVPSAGGGRGLIATRNLPAGTLVLAEMPILVWPDIERASPARLRMMTESVLSSLKAYQATISMFPQKLEDVSIEEITFLREYLQDEFNFLIKDRNENEVLRVLLVLQHNAFSSGFYAKFSLINHSCNPNCIKFNPSKSNGKASEIWTTRYVLQGSDHTDNARVYIDIANTIEVIIDKYPNEIHLLLEEFPWSSSLCSARNEMKRTRIEGNRLVQMYSTSKKYSKVFSLRNPGDFYWGEIMENMD